MTRRIALDRPCHRWRLSPGAHAASVQEAAMALVCAPWRRARRSRGDLLPTAPTVRPLPRLASIPSATLDPQR